MYVLFPNSSDEISRPISISKAVTITTFAILIVWPSAAAFFVEIIVIVEDHSGTRALGTLEAISSDWYGRHNEFSALVEPLPFVLFIVLVLRRGHQHIHCLVVCLLTSHVASCVSLAPICICVIVVLCIITYIIIVSLMVLDIVVGHNDFFDLLGNIRNSCHICIGNNCFFSHILIDLTVKIILNLVKVHLLVLIDQVLVVLIVFDFNHRIRTSNLRLLQSLSKLNLRVCMVFGFLRNLISKLDNLFSSGNAPLRMRLVGSMFSLDLFMAFDQLLQFLFLLNDSWLMQKILLFCILILLVLMLIRSYGHNNILLRLLFFLLDDCQSLMKINEAALIRRT